MSPCKKIPEFCITVGVLEVAFQWVTPFPCKKFLAYESPTENRQLHKVPCDHGRTLALALSRNFRKFCMEGVLESQIENFT